MSFFGFSLMMAYLLAVPMKEGRAIELNPSLVKVDVPLTMATGIEVDKEYVYITTDAGFIVYSKKTDSGRYFGVKDGYIPPWHTGIILVGDRIIILTDREGLIETKKGGWRPSYDRELAWKTSLLGGETDGNYLLLWGKPRDAYYTYIKPLSGEKAKRVPTVFGKERGTLFKGKVVSYSPEAHYLRIYDPKRDTTWTTPLKLTSENPRPSITRITSHEGSIWVLLDLSRLYKIKNPVGTPKLEEIKLPKKHRVFDFAFLDGKLILGADSGVFIGTSGSWKLLEKVPNVKKVALYENEVWYLTDSLFGRVGDGKSHVLEGFVPKGVNLLQGSGFVHMYLSGPFYGKGGIYRSIGFLRRGVRPERFRYFYGVIGVVDSVVPLLNDIGSYRFGLFKEDGTLTTGKVIPGREFKDPVYLNGRVWGLTSKSLLYYDFRDHRWDSLLLKDAILNGEGKVYLVGTVGKKFFFEKDGKFYLFDFDKRASIEVGIPERDTLYKPPIASQGVRALVGGMGRIDFINVSAEVLKSFEGDEDLFYKPLLLYDSEALILSAEEPSLDISIPKELFVLDLKNGEKRRIEYMAGIPSLYVTYAEIEGDTVWLATRCGVIHFEKGLLFK